MRKKAKKLTAAAVSPKEAVLPAPKKAAAAPAPKVVYRRPAPPPVLMTMPIEPTVRFGTWTQVYGDYERRSAKALRTLTFVVCQSGPFLPAYRRALERSASSLVRISPPEGSFLAMMD